MSALGLPSVSVVFQEAAEAAISPAGVGSVALVIQDAAITDNAVEVYSSLTEALAAHTWTDANAAALTYAFYGRPLSVIAACVKAAGTLSDGYALLEAQRFDVCTVAGLGEATVAAFVTWAKGAYDDLGKKSLYLAAGATTPDHPAIINFETSDVTIAGAAVTTPSYTLLPLIAGVIAGQQLWESVTYKVIPLIEDCVHLTRAEADAAIGDGKLILYHDGQKVKIARGVTSLTTVTPTVGADYGPEWRKIKVVRILNRIEEDVRIAVEDSYIGKMPNDVVHKQLLIAAILDYLRALELAGVLRAGTSTLDIDLESTRTYLKTIMSTAEVEAMDEGQIREADTDDKLYLLGTVRPMDAIEDVEITFNL